MNSSLPQQKVSSESERQAKQANSPNCGLVTRDKGWFNLPGGGRRQAESMALRQTEECKRVLCGNEWVWGRRIYTEVIWLVSESRCGDQWAKVGVMRAGQWKFTESMVKAGADCNRSLWSHKMVGIILFCSLIECLLHSDCLTGVNSRCIWHVWIYNCYFLEQTKQKRKTIENTAAV